MKIKVYTIVLESFRYGDSQGQKVWRYFSKKHRDEALEKELQSLRKISGLTEYQPDCFEDSNKWVFDYKKNDETIDIIEKEEGELLNQLIIEARKDKIKKITE